MNRLSTIITPRARGTREHGISVGIRNLQTNIGVNTAHIRRAVRLTVKKASRTAISGSIDICVIDDKTMARLNRTYHAASGPTDVLAFATSRARNRQRDKPGYRIHADIAVSADTALSNSLIYKTTPREELTLYCIHGVLHILGYEDHTTAGRAEMRKQENLILAACKKKC